MPGEQSGQFPRRHEGREFEISAPVWWYALKKFVAICGANIADETNSTRCPSQRPGIEKRLKTASGTNRLGEPNKCWRSGVITDGASSGKGKRIGEDHRPRPCGRDL